MSLFYLLRRNSDPAVLGVKNGIKQANIERVGYQNPEKFDLLKESLGTNKYWDIKDSIKDMRFELECVRLLPKAKLTDFLQFGPHLMNCPFLISERVAFFLDRYRILNHRLFPSTIIGDGKEYRYYLFYIESIDYDWLDYSRSIFYTGNKLIGKKYHKFGSASERMDFVKSNAAILDPGSICLSDRFPSRTDLFALGANIFISERLKIDLDDFSLDSGVLSRAAFGDAAELTIEVR